ncbi:MAG TPA: hypothetical protein ENK57_21445, partial [Polyangiaceae bacterium]|nr:hypothetical protein [Polyangiaceae bacterium]
MDMACAPLDCDDRDPNVNPAADESCDLPGVDDDCDGVVDEGCPLSFSGRHMTTRLLSRPGAGDTVVVHTAPELNADGTRIYFASSSSVAGALWVAERTYIGGTTYGEFGPPAQVRFEAEVPGRHLQVSITGDELEIFIVIENDARISLFTSTRPAVTDGFALPTAFAPPGSTAPLQPSISRDGLELIVVDG